MQDFKKGNLPMRHGMSLSHSDSPTMKTEKMRKSKVPYASVIGSIMYAMLCTRPDVSYALSVTSRYQSCPGDAHWTIVNTILKYLRRTKDICLVYGGKDELLVEGYTDANFQIDKDDSKPQSGYVFCLNDGAVSWCSSKQGTVAGSTTEVEYIAASKVAKEVCWIKKFISELGVVPSIENPVQLLYDNTGAIAQAKEPITHHRSKNVLRKYHLIRDIAERGHVSVCKVDTEDNLADPLTKPLTQVKYDKHMHNVGLKIVCEWR
ncbi:transmembrane signal receptor [Lithospermum erythrorhizon]|uniref:Transmembrane signal receptor n=1 Tax=Lithospermum erythrorhizon TaxID=34254 RepID=A0AAV3P9M8_LITER